MTWKGNAPSILLLLLMILAGGLPLLAVQGIHGLDLPASGGRAGNLWIWNLGDRPAQVTLASSQSLRIAAGSFREVAGNPSGWVSFRPGSQLVFVSAPRELDASDFELDLRGTVRADEAEPSLVHLTRPAWAQDLLVQAAGRSPAGPGGTLLAAPEVGEDDKARFAVGLLDEGSAAIVTLRDGGGTKLQSFSVASTMPVRLRAALGSAGEADDAHAEVKVLHGRAVTRFNRDGLPLKTPNGTASVSTNLVFSGSYSFSVTGGPASTCGELDIYRNGNWEFTPGWFCTNSSGNGSAGPWTWSSKTSDETGDPVYIRWPDNSATTSTYVIIDKNPAYTYIDSPMPTTSTPTSYYGHASDATWGTGFDFGYAHFSVFEDRSTGKFWDPSTLHYDSNSEVWVTPSFTSQSGRWYVSWGGSSFPSVSAHTTGHQYRWYTCFSDAQNGYCTPPYDFTAN